MSGINLKNASPDVEEQLREARWRCRTDLIFLCNYVLGYNDVTEELHGPVVANLQPFPLPPIEKRRECDRLINGVWHFTPAQNIEDLEGKRRMLLLDSRGFLKTTINCIAHTIQWLLNYPDMSVMIVQSNSDKAEMILSEIKAKFQANERFRALFPEFCPQKRINDWGRRDRMTVECKRLSNPRGGVHEHKEESIITASIERGMAGVHVDLIKFSDVVDVSNINTEGIKTVISNFALMQNLLVGPLYWIDVEGTRYNHGDLYGSIIENEEKLPAELKEWKIFVRGATFRDWGDKPEQFTMDSVMLKPEKLDEKGYPVSRWPKRWPNKKLAAIKADNPWIYNCQQQNNPSAGDGVQTFPVNHQYPKWISPQDFVRNVRVSSYEISIDTAETTGKRADYTAIVVGAWASNGKCYVIEVVHGRFLPSDILSHVVKLCNKYRTRLGKVKIEETGFVRGLMPSLRRIMDTNGIHIPVDTIKRDTQEGKNERISNTLQPWYAAGDLIFVDDLPQNTKAQLIRELREFPNGKNDDILDAVSDLFQNRNWFGRNAARGFAGMQKNIAWERMLGILSFEDQALYGDTSGIVDPNTVTGVY